MHMPSSTCNLPNLKPYKGSDKIVVGNDNELKITHTGMKVAFGLKMSEVLVVPKLKKNLLSMSKIAKDNSYTIEFDELYFIVKK